jgi:hypothetical protein
MALTERLMQPRDSQLAGVKLKPIGKGWIAVVDPIAVIRGNLLRASVGSVASANHCVGTSWTPNTETGYAMQAAN